MVEVTVPMDKGEKERQVSGVCDGFGLAVAVVGDK